MAIRDGFSYKGDNDLEESLSKIRETEYFDVRILAFVLVDLVPYERKDEMISKFETLFSLPKTGARIDKIKDLIKDITESGLAGYSARLGNIHNNKKLSPHHNQAIITENSFILDSGGVTTELPDEIDRIEVFIRQDVNFCYYAYYFCYVNKDYWNINIKNTYIHSKDLVPYANNNNRIEGKRLRGPKLDPVIQEYENKVAQFLSNFANGIFVNKDYFSEKAVPSIRILSTSSIDFSNILKWIEKHSPFLEYLRISIYNSNIDITKIISLQTDKIFQKSNVSKGITILYSEKDVPEKKYQNKFKTILSNAKVYNDAIADYFLPLYWSNSNIFSQLEFWNKKINEMMFQIKNKNFTLKDLEDKVIQTINFYGEFTRYNNQEKVNIRTARKTFNINKNLVGPPSFTVHLYKFDLFKNISKEIEITLDDEEILIDDVQKQIDVLSSYYRDRSNLKLSVSNLSLQKRIKWFTILLSIVGIIISAIPFIGKFLGV